MVIVINLHRVYHGQCSVTEVGQLRYCRLKTEFLLPGRYYYHMVLVEKKRLP